MKGYNEMQKLSAEKQRLVVDFNRKIEADPSLIEDRSCLCGGNQGVQLYSYDRYGFWHPVLLCEYCGLIYSKPNLTAEAYKLFYSWAAAGFKDAELAV